MTSTGNLYGFLPQPGERRNDAIVIVTIFRKRCPFLKNERIRIFFKDSYHERFLCFVERMYPVVKSVLFRQEAHSISLKNTL